MLKECVGQDEGPNTGGVVRRLGILILPLPIISPKLRPFTQLAYVMYLGGDNCIQVSLSRQKLNVVCYGAWAPSLQASCRSIVDTMPLDDVVRSFGIAIPQVGSIKLPFVLVSREFDLHWVS